MKIDRERENQLIAIGSELDDLYFSGRLDFETFKSLVERALEACGEDTDPLEMFMAMAREAEWEEWILKRLAARRAQRVA